MSTLSIKREPVVVQHKDRFRNSLSFHKHSIFWDLKKKDEIDDVKERTLRAHSR